MPVTALFFVFQFIFNLMACGKGNANQPIEDFITQAGQLDARADANDARADTNDARILLSVCIMGR